MIFSDHQIELRRLRKQRFESVSALVEKVELRGLRNLSAEERYRLFEEGEHDKASIPYTDVQAILKAVEAPRPLRDAYLEPYQFGVVLDRLITESGQKKKDVADKIGSSPFVMSRLISGTEAPTVDLINDLSDVLHLDRQKTEDLLSASGLLLAGLQLAEPTPRRIQAIQHLFQEAVKGLGEDRKKLPKAVLPKEPHPESSGIVGRDDVIEAARQLINWSSQQAIDSPLLVSVGRYLGQPHDYSIADLSYPLRSALAAGASVEILYGSPEDPAVASDCVVESLELFGLGSGKFLPRVYDPSSMVDEPQKLIRTGDWTLHIWSRNQSLDSLETAILTDQFGDLYTGHFRSLYDSAPPLAQFFDNTLEGHVELEKALLEAESRSKGRHLMKRSINGLMIPALVEDDQSPTCWEWERRYLVKKYEPTSSNTEKLLEEFQRTKQKRAACLMKKLQRYRCCDICCESTISNVLLRDGLLTESQEEREWSESIRHRVTQKILWWLENFDNYELVLVPDAFFEGSEVFFEVAAKDSAFVQVLGPNNQNYHLQLHDPRLLNSFEGFFLETWRKIDSEYRNKERTIGILRSIEHQFMGFQ